MSEQLAVVRRWIELYNERGDVAEFISLLDPEVELQTPGGPRLHGHDQARAWFEKAPEGARARIIPEHFVEGDEAVVGLGSTEVRWVGSGELAHKSESAAVFRFRAGRIVGWQPFESHRAALDATGLSLR